MFGRTAKKEAVCGTYRRLKQKVSLGITCYNNLIVMLAEISRGLRHVYCKTEIVFCMAETS